MKVLSIAILLTAGFAACNADRKKTDIKKLANDFAGTECRAMQLREKRFALANEIRFTQDTILHFAHTGDTTRLNQKLQQLNNEKEHLLQTSRALGDSLKTVLDNLQQTHLADTASKRIFNEELASILKRKGCL